MADFFPKFDQVGYDKEIKRMHDERLAKLRQDGQTKKEEDYVSAVVEQALRSKWVKEGEKEILIEKYLKPIFKKYLEIIEELRGLELPEEEVLLSIILLNAALESTYRIGQTDPNNILLSISDLKTKAERRGVYVGWALSNFYTFISQTI